MWTPGGHPSPAASRVLLAYAANVALFVRRDDRAFVGLAHLHLLLLFWSVRRSDLAPPGSAARALAKLAVWTLTAALTRRMLPPPLAAAAWAMAATAVRPRGEVIQEYRCARCMQPCSQLARRGVD
jgi:hypothetical protein